MKLLRSGLVMMLIPLMVLSAGGFNIFTHWCHKTGDRIVSFQTPESCSHDQVKHHGHTAMCCHEQIENGGSCCEDHHVFIRTVNELSANDDAVEFPSAPECDLIFTDTKVVEQKPVLSGEYAVCDYTSPPERSAKYMVVKYNQKKLDCC